MQKTKRKQQKQKQEWQPTDRNSDKVEQKDVAPAKRSQVIRSDEETSKPAQSPARIARGKEERNWRKATRKSIARSKEKAREDSISIINGFNILAESGLQLINPRQLGEGSNRHRGQAGEEGYSQALFIPV